MSDRLNRKLPVRILAGVRLTWKRLRSLTVERSGAVLAVRQAVDHVVAVEGIEAVVKPGAALGQRSGEFQARCPFIDVQAAIGGDAGDEIGAAEAQAVVAHLGFRSSTPAEPRPFSAEKRLVSTSMDWMVSILTRVSRRPVTGSEMIEAVQRVVGLAGAAAIEMGAAGVVLHHAIHQRQGVAVVLRGGVRNRLDFGVVEFLAVGRLLRVDGGRRGGHVDALGEFLQMIQGDGQFGRSRSNAWAVLVEIET